MHKWFGMDSKIILGFFFILLASPIFMNLALHYKKPHVPPKEKQINSLKTDEIKSILDKPDSAVLYSIDPSNFQSNPDSPFQSWKVLGQASIKDLDLSDATAAVATAIDSYQESMGHMACFNPRHGIRIQKGTRTYDFVLCYECLRLEILEGNTRLAVIGVSGSPDKLNAILEKFGIPISKR